MMNFKRLRWLLAERGQITIPSVLLMPTLLLFVYLLYETTRLSREKINHQFGVDSAAFIEIINASDYLNRTAYVNGAFPARIFKEAFDGVKVVRSDNGGNDNLYDILYENNAIPKGGPWNIQYKNTFPNTSKVTLFTKEQAEKHYFFWDQHMVSADGVYPTYYKVYSLLGSIQTSQKSVYEKLANGAFYCKSYYLNTGLAASSCKGGGRSVPRVGSQMQYLSEIYFEARKFLPGLLGVEHAYVVKPKNPIAVHLFQYTKVSGVPGSVGFSESWTAPSNYFNIGLGASTVKVTATLSCPKGRGADCTQFPQPEPRYQVKLYP